MFQLKQITAVVHGTVQGVSFRYYTQRAADRLGVTGWVANQRDGTVKVVAEGDEATLQEFLAFLHEGSPAAYVQRVAVTWAEASRPEAVRAFQKFSIRLSDG